MTTQIIGGITVLYPDSGKILTSASGTKSKGIWLGNIDNASNYTEVDDVVVEIEASEVSKIKDKVNEMQDNQTAIGQAIDGIMSFIMGGGVL